MDETYADTAIDTHRRSSSGFRMSEAQELSLDEALRQAIDLHQAGRAREAESWYRAILNVAPQHGDTNHNLGLLLQQYGAAEMALPYLKTAYASAPGNPQFVLSYAAALQTNDAVQSQQLLEDATGRGVVSAEIWCNLAILLRDVGDSAAAKNALHAALRLRPSYAIAYFNLGLIEQDEGLFEAAVASYRQAIAHQANFEQAHNNLGLVLQEIGDMQAAIAHYTIALIIAPQYAQAAFNRGTACQELKLSQQALMNFCWAVLAAPDFAKAHNELGLTLLSLGGLAEAASHFRSAIAIEPDVVAARVNLVNAQMKMLQWNEAQTQIRQAIAHSPDCSAAYHNLGTILRHFNDFGRAEIAYHRALAIDSGFVDAMFGLAAVLRYHDLDATADLCRQVLELNPGFAAANVLLAECLASRGLFADAGAQLRRAIVLNPAMAEAWAAIPTLRKMTRADEPWLARVHMLANSGLPTENESFLRYALGKTLDDLAEYAQAFDQYRIANELMKQYAIAYNRKAEEHRVDWICSSYDRSWIGKHRPIVSDSERPIFVLGMPRSGTSLVEQILAAHPLAAGAGELAYWQNALAEFSSFAAHELARQLPTEQELLRLGEDYLGQLSHFNAAALRVIDKMPANFQCIGLIHAALPKARIIHVRRNPVDTCLSIYFQHFEGYHGYANDLENLAHFYRLYRRLMSHWTSILPKESILHLPYEALVEDQETVTRQLLDFVGLPWDASCLEFQNVARKVGTASNWQVRQSINRRSVERWRHYESELGALLPLLDDKPSSHNGGETL